MMLRRYGRVGQRHGWGAVARWSGVADPQGQRQEYATRSPVERRNVETQALVVDRLALLVVARSAEPRSSTSTRSGRSC